MCDGDVRAMFQTDNARIRLGRRRQGKMRAGKAKDAMIGMLKGSR
jgi:hypothetical protein